MIQSRPAADQFAASELALLKVLANSVPKSGTHLLKKCLSLFPGLRTSKLHVDLSLNAQECEELLQRSAPGTIISGHLPGYKAYIRAAKETETKTFLIVRDPRDVAVSAAHYYTKAKEHYLYNHFNNRLSDNEARLMAVIKGIQEKILENRRVGLRNITEIFEMFIPWSWDPINLTVRFESLVGPQGGGNRELQVQTIQQMLGHLDISLPPAMVEQIADEAYDRGAVTFRKGLIGDWRNYFTVEHKQAFKDVAGQLLIQLGYEKNHDW